MTQHQREHWSGKLGFAMAAIGSAIGLGTLWKFPYMTGNNGGGLFVLIYLGCTIVIGIPVFIGELVLGRRSQRGAVGAFVTFKGHDSNWKIVGWIGVLSSFLIMTYYNIVAGWGLNYILLSLSQFYVGRSPDEIRSVFTVLASAGGISLLFHFLFTMAIVFIVVQGVRKGVEYWARIMTMGLLGILLLLFAYTCTLPGFPKAFHFVLSFDATNLTRSGVLEALGLAFFTMSLGQGIMITYGSYMSGNEDLPKTAFIIGIADVVVSLLAALVIFPIIFTFNLPAEQGEGLIFQTLPVIFSTLPAPLILSTIFFILFCFTAFTSAIALMEVCVANLCDLYVWSRKKATLLVGCAVLLLGIPSALSHSSSFFAGWEPMYGRTYFATVDHLVNSTLLPLAGLFTALFVGWAVDKEVILAEFSRSTSWNRCASCWLFVMRYVVPVGVGLVLLSAFGLIG